MKYPECCVERNSNSSLGDLWWRRFAEMLVQSVGSEWPFKITRYIFINFSQRKQNHTGARHADNFFFFSMDTFISFLSLSLSLSISPTRKLVSSFSFQWAEREKEVREWKYGRAVLFYVRQCVDNWYISFRLHEVPILANHMTGTSQ